MSTGDIGKDILIATADENDMQQLKEICETSGYRVFTATTGDDTARLVRERKPDVLLMDAALQQRDSYSLLKELREDSNMNALPIVMLANPEDMDAKIRGMELGADDYMTRPFKTVELQTRVGSALMVREYRKRLMAVEAELAQLRALDPVSGAGTAAQLKTSLDSELARARRYGRPVSLLVMGLDDFKEFQQKAGDKCDDYVGRLAKSIRHTLRGADRLFRIEPGEFVIMLPETDLRGAKLAAERLYKIAASVATPLRGTEKVEPMLRFGGAVFPQGNIHDADDLVQAAQQVYRTLLGKNLLIFELNS